MMGLKISNCEVYSNRMVDVGLALSHSLFVASAPQHEIINIGLSIPQTGLSFQLCFREAIYDSTGKLFPSTASGLRSRDLLIITQAQHSINSNQVHMARSYRRHLFLTPFTIPRHRIRIEVLTIRPTQEEKFFSSLSTSLTSRASPIAYRAVKASITIGEAS
ncbi:hypothetical protein BT63DRAFT_181072 [Microthyrium microscopicum]|uniref:Uncharacterized protein n=1 Tax=Microthyrium microscopicum TaxID=703497 RepID=A0A6A6UJ93_9PEZI|nr:hypothetical protein BT63DRAFT_181072 [Microthyrium microscopicum]